MSAPASVLSQERERSGSAKRVLVFLLALAAIVYAGMIGYYMYAETSFVFHPRKAAQFSSSSLPSGTQPVMLESADGVRLSGWILRAEPAASPYWILYFHGNGGNIASPAPWYRLFRELGVNTFAIDYRGYGLSQGTPSEAGLYRDTHAAYEYLIKKLGVPEDRIILYGHSLGSALGIQLAAETHPAGLIAEGSLMSVAARGQELYPFLPVSLIVRNRFDSAAAIASVRCPKLFLHGRRDNQAPIEHGRYLYSHAVAPKTWVELDGDHSSAVKDPSLPASMHLFLASLPQ